VVIRANFIVGQDGSSTHNGSSIGLSNKIDKERFRRLRTECDVVVIGGNTARNEPYKNLNKPLVVITSSKNTLIEGKTNYLQLNQPLEEAIAIIKEKFGENILVEAGWKLLRNAIENKLIDELYLTINHSITGENIIDLKFIYENYAVAQSNLIENTQLIKLVRKL
jgi:riboflavin biosynthesis pyrimidine reductase